MLYFLVFAIPFVVAVLYLSRRNRLVKEKYELLLSRLTLTLRQLPADAQPDLTALKVEGVLSYEDIKRLERHVNQVNRSLHIHGTRVISNTFNSRWKQLLFIEEKIRTIEKTLSNQHMRTE